MCPPPPGRWNSVSLNCVAIHTFQLKLWLIQSEIFFTITLLLSKATMIVTYQRMKQSKNTRQPKATTWRKESQVTDWSKDNNKNDSLLRHAGSCWTNQVTRGPAAISYWLKEFLCIVSFVPRTTMFFQEARLFGSLLPKLRFFLANKFMMAFCEHKKIFSLFIAENIIIFCIKV